MTRKATARYEAASAQLDALILSVAQATVELAGERHTHMHTVWHNRGAIASDVLRQAVGCAREDPDSEYRRVLEAMGVER